MSVTLTARSALTVQEWANLMGISVLEFNNIDISQCSVDPAIDGCNQFWSHWQYATNTSYSLEQLAFYIQQAEEKIENYLGYYVAPKWSYEEEHLFPNKTCTDFNKIKFLTNWKNVITGGIPKLTSLIEADVNYSDVDTDGFAETATITIAYEGFQDANFTFPNRVRLFFVGHEEDDRYEITDINSYTYADDVLTVTLDSWLLIDPVNYIPKGFSHKLAFNPCEDDIFVESVSVYFEEPDTCKPNATIFWNGDNVPCTSDNGCIEVTAPACIRWINKCEGIFSVQPVTVDGDGCISGYLSTYCDIRNYPTGIRINYLSGCYEKNFHTPKTLVGYAPCSQLKMAIAALAITYFGIQTCECNCIEDSINYYNEDLSMGGQGLASYNYPQQMFSTVFGNAKRGSFEAFNIIESIKSRKGLCYKEW